MRARRAENPEQQGTAVSCPAAEGARRTWAQLYRALVRAQPDPERSGGARPTPQLQLPFSAVDKAEAGRDRYEEEQESMPDTNNTAVQHRIPADGADPLSLAGVNDANL